jgi:hypothetical protein
MTRDYNIVIDEHSILSGTHTTSSYTRICYAIKLINLVINNNELIVDIRSCRVRLF